MKIVIDRDQPPNLAGALPVDLEQHVVPGRHLVREPVRRGRVPVAVDVGVLEELAAALRAWKSASSTNR